MKENPSKVFIIQQPTPKEGGWVPDMSPAAQYGRLEFVFDAGDRPYSDPKKAVKVAKAKLKNFNPETDFLCWPNFADPAAQWVVIAVLVGMGFHKLRYLYWNKGRKQVAADRAGGGYYFPIEIDVA